jgi:hypothetical protein
MYYWLLSTLPPSVQKPKFSPDTADKELLQIAQEIHTLYSEIPTTEIWTPDCTNTTLKQIQYCQEMNLFASQELEQLIKNQFVDLLTYLENKATTQESYQLYLSEVQIDNNCIWTQAERPEVFIRHQSFNVVHTENPIFCEDTFYFLEGLSQKSLLLSGAAEKQRTHFFTTLKSKMW